MIKVDVMRDINRVTTDMRATQAELNRAVPRAMNWIGDRGRTAVSRAIRTRYTVKAKAVNNALVVIKAKPGVFEVTIRAAGRPIAIINFSARQTKAGVTVNVMNGRKLFPHAFLAKMPTGHVGVYDRKPGTQLGKRGKMILNRKIGKEFYGPSVPAMFSNKDMQSVITRVVDDNFSSRLTHELEFRRR